MYYVQWDSIFNYFDQHGVDFPNIQYQCTVLNTLYIQKKMLLTDKDLIWFPSFENIKVENPLKMFVKCLPKYNRLVES